MFLSINRNDLRPKFQELALESINLKHFNHKTQQAIKLVGLAKFVDHNQQTKHITYPQSNKCEDCYGTGKIVVCHYCKENIKHSHCDDTYEENCKTCKGSGVNGK